MIKVGKLNEAVNYQSLVKSANKGEDVSKSKDLGKACWQQLFPQVKDMANKLGIDDTNVIVKAIKGWLDDHPMNESADPGIINEALKPAKIGWYGNRDPKLADGTPELSGSNKVIEVAVVSDQDEYVAVGVMGDEGEELLQKSFSDKKSAIQLAEKLLKEVKDPMYDAKKVAKKYGMQYHNDK